MNFRLFSLPAFGLAMAFAPSFSPPAAPTVGGARFVMTATGNLARYRVRERLVGKELDNDAVGQTTNITGSVVISDAGAVVAEDSKITVDLTTLVSDSQRRDRYVRTRILSTDSFPSASLAVTSVTGLQTPLPTAGNLSFQLQGILSLRGVSRPTVWNVTAVAGGNSFTGRATTKFTFRDFKLNQPKVPVVLSVADSITLEYNFSIQRAAN